jgi:hypothetical protein
MPLEIMSSLEILGAYQVLSEWMKTLHIDEIQKGKKLEQRVIGFLPPPLAAAHKRATLQVEPYVFSQ